MILPRSAQSMKDAQAAHEIALKADPTRSPNDPTLPLYQWCAMEALCALEKQFISGDRTALLAAIRRCANHDLPLPSWASKAYISAYDQVLNCDEKSWDVVFGTPYPKGANINAMSKRRNLRFAVWLRVNELRKTAPIDGQLFATVGKEMRPIIGKSEASELYYEAKRLLGI